MPLAAAWVMRFMIEIDSVITGLSFVTNFCSTANKNSDATMVG